MKHKCKRTPLLLLYWQQLIARTLLFSLLFLLWLFPFLIWQCAIYRHFFHVHVHVCPQRQRNTTQHSTTHETNDHTVPPTWGFSPFFFGKHLSQFLCCVVLCCVVCCFVLLSECLSIHAHVQWACTPVSGLYSYVHVHVYTSLLITGGYW